jgi:hypothetical protein
MNFLEFSLDLLSKISNTDFKFVKIDSEDNKYEKGN